MSSSQQVVLMRHGEALPTFAHPERPLNRPGQVEARETARWITDHLSECAEIRHSRLLRARQTAEIVARELAEAGRSCARLQVNTLDPAADPEIVSGDLDVDVRSVVLVGHVPLLDRLLRQLIGGEACASVGNFETAMAVCLTRNDRVWTLDWSFTPDRARR